MGDRPQVWRSRYFAYSRTEKSSSGSALSSCARMPKGGQMVRSWPASCCKPGSMSWFLVWVITSRRLVVPTPISRFWIGFRFALASPMPTPTITFRSWSRRGPTRRTVGANPAPRSLATDARAERVMFRCDELATCSEELGRITRPYGSAALQAAREMVAGWMREAGLDAQVDTIGNLRGRMAGSSPNRPALLLGSHLDSVRDAGRYDGPLGILVALGVVERLQAEGRSLPFPVEVIAFADEEGLRFQSTYLGSRALAGAFDPRLL